MTTFPALINIAIVCFSLSFVALAAQALMATYVLWLNRDAPMIEANKNA